MHRSKLIAVLLTVLILFPGCEAKAPRKGSASSTPSEAITLARGGKPGDRKKPPAAAPKTGFAELAKKYDLISVPTYDGSGQVTHPKLLYFPKGWHGYKYWMSYTPYPNGNDDYENPSVDVSNDLVHWSAPAKGVNPVSGIPTDVKYGGHYSDSHIVMHGNTMELWYRYNWGDMKTHKTDYSIDYYYRRTSSDGVHWSKPQLMQSSKEGILSLAVNYTGSGYEFWYTTYSHQLMHAESTNGKDWKYIRACSIALPHDYEPWHQDVVQVKGEYYLLQTGINIRHYSFSLFLSHSSDGVNWSNGVPFFPSSDPVIRTSQAWLYRSTLFEQNNSFAMMIAVRFPDGRWYMMKSAMPISEYLQADWGKPVVLPGASAKSKTKAV